MRIWRERLKILEGIKNKIFKKEDVEIIAKTRLTICSTCEHIDKEGSSCIVPGTSPCCKLCGCSLALKTRALSAECDDGRWMALITQEEQEKLDRDEDSI